MTSMTSMPIHTPMPVSNSTGTTLSSRAIAGRDTLSIGRSVTLEWKKTPSGWHEKTVLMAHPRRPGALTSSGVNGREAQRMAKMTIGIHIDRMMDSMIKPWLPCLKTLTLNIPPGVMSVAAAVLMQRATRTIGSTAIQKTTALSHMTSARSLLWDSEQRHWEADTPTCRTTIITVPHDASTDVHTASMTTMPSSPHRGSW